MVATFTRGRASTSAARATPARAAGDDGILVVCGGVIPPADHADLRKAGVAAVFGPGTNIPAAAAEIIGLIAKRRVAAE